MTIRQWVISLSIALATLGVATLSANATCWTSVLATCGYSETCAEGCANGDHQCKGTVKQIVEQYDAPTCVPNFGSASSCLNGNPREGMRYWDCDASTTHCPGSPSLYQCKVKNETNGYIYTPLPYLSGTC